MDISTGEGNYKYYKSFVIQVKGWGCKLFISNQLILFDSKKNLNGDIQLLFEYPF